MDEVVFLSSHSGFSPFHLLMPFYRLVQAAIVRRTLAHLHAKDSCEVGMIVETRQLSDVSDTLVCFGEKPTGVLDAYTNDVLPRTRPKRLTKHALKLTVR